MSNQLFKYDISNTLLFSLLDKISTKIDDKYYILNNASYKKGMYYKYIQEFCDEIKDHYFESKRYYVERKLDYNKFTTIIRHICRANATIFTSKIKYDKSCYEIVYYIYF
jgi:hypothetical protein